MESNSDLDNNSTNEIWRVGQAADGDGYVEVLEDGGTVGCKLDASGNSFTMGNFGVGVASPGTKLTVSGAVHITSTANTNKNVEYNNKLKGALEPLATNEPINMETVT